ncbi:MAG: hypothetical protein HRT47_02040 [Candidatus Caenarcaniphilales bacterium]|nr:hypothetical protein [Candidatus Caenarcaniphilales bacterium]
MVINNSNPNFYGVAASFGDHGLSITVGKQKGSSEEVTKDNKLSSTVSAKQPIKQAVKKLVSIIGEVAKLQEKENKKNHINYRLPVVMGCPDDLTELKSFKPNRSKKDPLTKRSDIENQIIDSIKKNTKKLSAELQKANYVRASQEQLNEKANQECPVENLEETAKKALEGDPNAKLQMHEWMDKLALDIAQSTIMENGSNLADVKFINIREPEWVEHFNQPELKKDLAKKVAILVRRPNQEFDIKFPSDFKDDQFFNVLRPKMRTNIQEALHMKTSTRV